MPEEAAPKASEDPILGGIDGVRTTAKWLIAAFAAIGGSLIAGSQLSDLGKLTDDTGRLLLALLGATVGLAGAAFAIYFTAKVLLPTQVLLGEVIKDEGKTAIGKAVAADPGLLEGHGSSIKETHEKYVASLAAYEAAWKAYSDETDATKKAPLATELSEAEGERNTLAETLNHIRKLALFTAVKDAFSSAAPFIIGGAAAAAAGIVLFAYAAHPEADPKSRVPDLEKPTAVVATLSEVKAKGLTDDLGKDCDLARVHALALSGNAKDGYDIVTVPNTDGCNAVRLTVGADKVAPDVAVP
jgi:hypothetical protein